MGHERDNVASSNNRLQEESLEDPVLQERSDNIYDGKLPVGGRVNQMQLLANEHIESSSTTKSEMNNPSYIMVMSEEKSSTTAAPTKSSTAPPIAVTDMNDFLSRIISASRESGNKIFVVPIPGPLSNEQKEDTNKISTSKFYVEEDDDEATTIEEEEMTTPKKPEIISKTSRPQSGPKRSSDTYGDQGVRSYYPANNNGGNFAPPSQQQQQQQQQQKVQIQQQHVNPPKSYYNQPMQSQHHAQSQFPSPRPQLHHSHPPPVQQFAPPPPPHLRPHHPPPNFDQNQGYIPKPAQQQPVPYFHQPEAPPPPPAPVHKPNRDAQGYDSNRWGSVEDGGYGHVQEAPKGITITFGSNHGHGHGGYGGDYHSHGHHVEPFSMIKSLFLPFLPKPKVNLNGRVVFGVVLEKGVGLGGNKGGGGGAVSLGGYH